MTTENEAFLKSQLQFFLAASEDKRFPKKWREEHLRAARKIEKQLGLEGKKYNG